MLKQTNVTLPFFIKLIFVTERIFISHPDSIRVTDITKINLSLRGVENSRMSLSLSFYTI